MEDGDFQAKPIEGSRDWVLGMEIGLSSVVLRELDSGLAEAVSTLIWAAPRLQSEVAELKIVSRVV